MSTDDDKHFVQQVKAHLDQHADDIDELTVARLRAARMQALEHQPRRARSWLPMTGLATAAAAVLAVLLWQQGGGLPAGEDAWEILASGEDLELIEEWEFYDWLEDIQANS